jgi:hypothetical protein
MNYIEDNEDEVIMTVSGLNYHVSEVYEKP